MAGDPPAWQTLQTVTAFENRWTTVLLDQVALPDGRRYAYTRLGPAGIGVGVIGFNRAGELLVEREYRHGVGEVIWQAPGGLAGPQEDLRAAGLRELREETGYAPLEITDESVRYLGMVWDNPALGTAQSHLYAVWGLVQIDQPNPDTAEHVTLHWQTAAWLRAAVRTGEIRDRVLVAAAAYLMLNGWL